jgi:hypothetical protein
MKLLNRKGVEVDIEPFNVADKQQNSVIFTPTSGGMSFDKERLFQGKPHVRICMGASM